MASNFRTTAILFSATLIAISLALSQPKCSSQTQAPEAKRRFSINPKGWTLTVVPATRWQFLGPVANVDGDGSATVYESDFVPKEHDLILHELEGLGSIRVDYIKRFEANGKPYCYFFRGTCVKVRRYRKGKAQVQDVIVQGCVTGYALYDEDGDGKFETFDPYATKLPYIPELWLKTIDIQKK